MKGHKFHVRSKMKENNGKLKKLEASLIKWLLRISWQVFSYTYGSHSILSLSYSWILRVFLENSWRSVAYLGFGERSKMKSREAQQDIGFNSYRWISL